MYTGNLRREVIFKIHLKIIASKIQHFILSVKFIKKAERFRLSSILIKASKNCLKSSKKLPIYE